MSTYQMSDFPAGVETPTFKYKCILERCYCFLLEEIEPSYFLRNEDVSVVFASIRADVKEQTNRTAKNRLLLEHLKRQPEETIQLVLEKLEKWNGYIYRQLFPKTENYQDFDIEQVKRNILDNLPELLDEINIETLQTPLLSTGLITREELDALRSSSESLRTENLQFVKLVLHRGAEAIRVFLGSLENSRGESELYRRITKTKIGSICEGKSRNTEIKYETSDEENEPDENAEQEALYVKQGETSRDSDISNRSQSKDTTSAAESIWNTCTSDSMLVVYQPLLEECIGGTDLLSDLSDVIDRDGRLAVRNAGKAGGPKHSMHVLLDLMHASPHREKWKLFYKAMRNNDFKHVVTALQEETTPESVRLPYRNVLLQPENLDRLHILIEPGVQNDLTEKQLLSNEDVENIRFEKEMTGSDPAAILVTLDRLWRRKKEWLDELSNILKLSGMVGMDDLVEKLLQYSQEQTNLKQIQVESEEELTKPKTLSGALGMGSNSRPETATDSDLPPLPDRVGTSLSFSNEDDTSRGSSLPVRVGTSLPAISDGSSCLSTNLNESNTSLPLPDQVGMTLSSAGETGQTTANTERMRGVDILNKHGKDTGSLNTDMVEELGEELYATVERSLHRNDSTFYQDEESVVSSDFDDKVSKTEKETDEATEKETFPTLEMRKYQLELAELAVAGQNTIICAETGTGKTYVALYVTEQHLASRKDARVVFLARTNALLEQQYEKFSHFLYKHKVYLLKTDKTAAMGRKLAMAKETHQVFFMTPQILLNNINSQQISLPEISLLIMDECHHTRKREPYNNVMKQYLTLKRRGDKCPLLPQVLGLTATIGVGKSSTLEGAVSHILSVCASLDVLDISKVQQNKEELESHVAVPKRETRKLMEKEKDVPKQIILDKMEMIENYVGKTEVVNQPKLKKQWDRKAKKKREGKQYQKWTIHFRNRVMCKLKSDPKLLRKLHVALTHLSIYNEALGVNYLMNSTHVADYIQQKLADDIKQHQLMLKEKPASIDDAEDQFMRYGEEVCQELRDMKGVLNDHLKTLRNFLVDLRSNLGDGVKGMIFVETRATAFALAKYITEELEMMKYKAAPFTGSKSSDSSEGMQEDEKVETLKKYRKGEINLLVATSVGSEGIDVPDCNFIITYNYTGNEADIMQMSGRARVKDSTVTHISDQVIQRREETSLQKALLMARAFDRLNDMKDEDRHRKIKDQQKTIQNTDLGSFFLENNVVKAHTDFSVICWKCQAFAGNSSDIRIYTGQHRITLDPDFNTRCIFEEVDETSRFKKRIIRCKKCKTKWGTTFALDALEVPVLKVKAFLFVPGYNGGDLDHWKERKRFKAWGKVEFFIDTIGKSQLMEILTRETSGAPAAEPEPLS